MSVGVPESCRNISVMLETPAQSEVIPVTAALKQSANRRSAVQEACLRCEAVADRPDALLSGDKLRDSHTDRKRFPLFALSAVDVRGRLKPAGRK